uniref:Uncharacterized protein n=1 Tax=Sphaerodactylus townsendi TaxID=933632 RepID=A0ACB8FVM3_9SAUR
MAAAAAASWLSPSQPLRMEPSGPRCALAATDSRTAARLLRRLLLWGAALRSASLHPGPLQLELRCLPRLEERCAAAAAAAAASVTLARHPPGRSCAREGALERALARRGRARLMAEPGGRATDAQQGCEDLETAARGLSYLRFGTFVPIVNSAARKRTVARSEGKVMGLQENLQKETHTHLFQTSTSPLNIGQLP